MLFTSVCTLRSVIESTSHCQLVWRVQIFSVQHHSHHLGSRGLLLSTYATVKRTPSQLCYLGCVATLSSHGRGLSRPFLGCTTTIPRLAGFCRSCPTVGTALATVLAFGTERATFRVAEVIRSSPTGTNACAAGRRFSYPKLSPLSPVLSFFSAVTPR